MMVRRLHSLAMFGPVANGLIEVVAGFTLILVLSGIYLWWPRRRGGGQGGGQGGGIVSVRGTRASGCGGATCTPSPALPPGPACSSSPHRPALVDPVGRPVPGGVEPGRARPADRALGRIAGLDGADGRGCSTRPLGARGCAAAALGRPRRGADRHRPGGRDPERSRHAGRLRARLAGGAGGRLRRRRLSARRHPPADDLPRPVYGFSRWSTCGSATSGSSGAGSSTGSGCTRARSPGGSTSPDAGLLPRDDPARGDRRGDVVEAPPQGPPRRAGLARRPPGGRGRHRARRRVRDRLSPHRAGDPRDDRPRCRAPGLRRGFRRPATA